MNESCLTYKYEWVVSHIWVSHDSHMNERCHTYQRVMSHIAMSHVPDPPTSTASHVYDMNYSYIHRPCLPSRTRVEIFFLFFYCCRSAVSWHDVFICDVTWFLHMWHDLFICDMYVTRSFHMWHDLCICDLIWFVAQSIHMWHDLFIWDMMHSYVTWSLHMRCDMISSQVTWNKLFT